MGYHIHRAIVVTSWHQDGLRHAHDLARRVFANSAVQVTGATPTGCNGYSSFLIAPDGSKLGWEESGLAEECREEWRGGAADAKSKGLFFDWVEVAFGGDEPNRNTRVLNHSGENGK